MGIKVTMKEREDMTIEKQETASREPLSPLSQLFVSPGFFCTIVITLGFQTKCNPSDIIEGLKNTWIKIPRFSSKVDCKKRGKAVWVPVKVRVEDHVIVPDIDHFNFKNPNEFIEYYTANVANTPMDMSRPLWEFHILNMKTPNAESLGIVKIHHSLGDGMSLMSLLLASSRKISDPNMLPTTAATSKKHVNAKCWLLLLVGRFWFIIRVIFITVIDLLTSLLTLLFVRDTKTPLMRAKFGDKAQSRKIIHRIISFDDVKLVKNTMNMKVNDVLLGMTQAGLSRYLSKNFDTKAKSKKILEKIRLRGYVAVNLRPATKIEDLADMMAKNSKCRWGNFVSIVLLPLWIKSEDDPLEYIRRAKATVDKKKISMAPLILYGIIKYAMKIFGEKVIETIMMRMCDHTTLSYSNVLGPHEEISFFNHPMSYVAASGLAGSQAVIIHYVSYVNKIVINLAVDPTVIPDPHLLCDDLVESLNIFKLALMEQKAHKMEV